MCSVAGYRSEIKSVEQIQCLGKQIDQFPQEGSNSESKIGSLGLLVSQHLHYECFFLNSVLFACLCEEDIITTRRYHFTPMRMAILKTQTRTGIHEGVEKPDPFYFVGGNVKLCLYCAKQSSGSSKS